MMRSSLWIDPQFFIVLKRLSAFPLSWTCLLLRSLFLLYFLCLWYAFVFVLTFLNHFSDVSFVCNIELGFALCFSLSTFFFQWMNIVHLHYLYWYDTYVWYLFCHHFIIFSFYFIILFCVDLKIFWKDLFSLVNLFYIQSYISLDNI